MKNVILVVVFLISFFINGISQQLLNGAWHQEKGSVKTILIIRSNYFVVATFDQANKKFVQTWGGVCNQDKDVVSATIEFHSTDKEQVGRKINFSASVKDNLLTTDIVAGETTWKKTDNSNTPLSGLWVITGREQNGTMGTIVPGERKTLKILTGTRFQWAAINTATTEFFGTGGGTYTFENGIYTEHIEFFSRDSTRIGQTLEFRGYVDGDQWDHSGKSSKGDPVHEIWTRLP